MEALYDQLWSPSGEGRRAMSGLLSKHFAPNLTVEPVGFYQSPNGPIVRDARYDASAEFLYVPRTYQSSKTPGFHSKRAKDLPHNPVYISTCLMRDSVGMVSGVAGSWKNHRFWGYGRKTMGTSVNALKGAQAQHYNTTVTPLMNEAEQRALSNLSAMKVNLAQAFAERVQTAGMLQNTITRVAQFALYVRQGRLADAGKILLASNRRRSAAVWEELVKAGYSRQAIERFTREKTFARNVSRPTHREFSSLWLELQYGWLPLLSDVHGAAELIAEQHAQDDASMVYRRSRPARAYGSATTSATYSHTYTEEGLTGNAKFTVSSKARCVIEYDVSSDFARMAQRTGISNPALLAWELVPYSFVVDWFLPVGNYLQNLNSSSGLRFVRGSTTVVSSGSGSSSSTSNGSVWSLGSPFVCTSTFAQIVRRPLTGFPSAIFPSVGYGLNTTRAANALALISQLFLRKA